MKKNGATPTPGTGAEKPRKERERRPISACRLTETGALATVSGPFANLAEFRKWVAAQKDDGVAYYPIRQVGPPAKWVTKSVGRVE